MDKLAELVPELQYDLIARITPGAMFCAAFAWGHRDELPFAQLSSAVALPFGVIASYLAGFLLDAVASATLGQIARHLVIVLGSRFEIWRVDIRKQIDVSRSGGRQTVLVKMMAERAMLRSLVTLTVVLWILRLPPMPSLATVAKLGMLAGGIALWLQWEFNVRLSARSASTLGGPQQPSQTLQPTSGGPD